MVQGPQLYPPATRITVHTLRLLKESLVGEEKVALAFCADVRDQPVQGGLKGYWVSLWEFLMVNLWGIATWGQPRMVWITDRRLLMGVGLDISEIPYAALEEVSVRRRWKELGLPYAEVWLTYEGGKKVALRIPNWERVEEALQGQWQGWKDRQAAAVTSRSS
ncbi:MAG: hypothetical protein NZ959_01635 [Armatimonadetes bacterium]|nr:hypothetical protein [Armatimonadota bacterium]MDW8121362.1 hypothetical protein [Armatimonadota bacterium]